MNAELCNDAGELIGNPNVLVNIVSTRVRQLNNGDRPCLMPLCWVPRTWHSLSWWMVRWTMS